MTCTQSSWRWQVGVSCASAACGLTRAAQAGLITNFQMNSPTQLVNSAGPSFYQPDLKDPGGSASPTYVPLGGIRASGAFRFDGVNDYFAFNQVTDYTFIQSDNLDWS